MGGARSVESAARGVGRGAHAADRDRPAPAGSPRLGGGEDPAHRHLRLRVQAGLRGLHRRLQRQRPGHAVLVPDGDGPRSRRRGQRAGSGRHRAGDRPACRPQPVALLRPEGGRPALSGVSGRRSEHLLALHRGAPGRGHPHRDVQGRAGRVRRLPAGPRLDADPRAGRDPRRDRGAGRSLLRLAPLGDPPSTTAGRPRPGLRSRCPGGDGHRHPPGAPPRGGRARGGPASLPGRAGPGPRRRGGGLGAGPVGHRGGGRLVGWRAAADPVRAADGPPRRASTSSTTRSGPPRARRWRCACCGPGEPWSRAA